MMCGVTFRVIPALTAYCFTMRSTERGVSREGSLPLKLMPRPAKRASLMSPRFLRYAATAFFAEDERNTTRTLSPLPHTENSSRVRSISALSAHNSETRSEEHTSELQSHVNLVCR